MTSSHPPLFVIRSSLFIFFGKIVPAPLDLISGCAILLPILSEVITKVYL